MQHSSSDDDNAICVAVYIIRNNNDKDTVVCFAHNVLSFACIT